MTLLLTFLNCFLEQLIARWSEANHPPSQWLAVVTVVLCFAQTKLTTVNVPRSSSVMARDGFCRGSLQIEYRRTISAMGKPTRNKCPIGPVRMSPRLPWSAGTR